MLMQRAKTGVVGLLALLSVLYLMPHEITRMVFVIIFIIAGWEWANFIIQDSLSSKVIFLLSLFSMMLCIHFLSLDITDIQIIFSFSITCWIFFLLSLFFYPIQIANSIGWLAGFIILLLGYFSIDWIFVNWGRHFFLSFLCLIWVMDIGAYFAGKNFGQLKLAKHISPNKTWEGVIGGLFLVTIFSILLSKIYDLDSFILVPFAIALGLLSVVGDLTISMFKRNVGIKDSGNLFPGHGGILDRLDSIVSSAPLFALGVNLFLN